MYPFVTMPHAVFHAWTQTATLVVLLALLALTVVLVFAGWGTLGGHRPLWQSRWLKLGWLDRLLFSADPEQQLIGRRFAVGVANCLAGLLALNYGSWVGAIDAAACQQLTLTGLALIGVLYVVMRSGLNRRLADPSMGEWSTMVAIVMMAWGYDMGGPGRPVALLLLFVILMFSIFTSTTRALVRACVLTAVAFGWVMWRVARAEQGLPYGAEMQMVYYGVLLLVLVSVSLLVAQLAQLRETARRRRHDLSKALQRIQELATQDELTGLPNRRDMQARLQHEQQRLRRSGGAATVALIDVDHFKAINDLHGHQAGDDVLRAIAQALHAGLRETDSVARWGGEEFLMLFPDTPVDDAQQVLRRIQSLLTAVALPHGLTVTFSAGVAALAPDDSVEHSVSAADVALYRAKAEGRNRVQRA